MRKPLTRPANLLTGIILILSLMLTAQAQDAPGAGNPIGYVPDVSVTLTTGIAGGKLVFIGVGGDIDGVINPDLTFQPGQVVQLTLINGDGTQHDLIAPDLGAATDIVTELGASSGTVFKVGEEGTYDYWCSLPGHRAAGMEGRIIVGEGAVEQQELTSIVRDPTDLPSPLEVREPVTHDITLTTTELEARLADGTSYRYWTFDDLVPGPFLRIRVGDTVNLKLHNHPDSTMMHSVDFHAVTGPGGGAVATQTLPGETTEFSFKAIIPGLFVYHCATPMVAHHITNGMYGLILVEPEEGLPEVDHEFYVMQGEIYTQDAFGKKGAAEFSVQKLLDEQPEYLTFNGSVGALTDEFPMHASVGDTVRIFFGVGGPNKASSFHVIGEMFDRIYDHGSFSHPPLHDVQTVLVPPGGATIVEFELEVPGRYILVDHALSRMERGLLGFLFAAGEDNLEIYHGPDSGAGN
jgi:nitrite reductase (NO-forming)